MNKVLDGIKFGFGIFLFFGLLFGIVSAIGFHTAEEILPGNFNGNYAFIGNGNNNLQIHGNASVGGTVGLNINSSQRYWAVGVKGSAEDGAFIIYDGTKGFRPFTINNKSNIGIGTNFPIARLSVNGNITANSICDETGTNCKDISTGWTSGSSLPEMKIYNVPGTYTWTVPVGVTKIRVKVAGGGGGGAADSYKSGSNGQQSSFTDNGLNIIAYGGGGAKATGAYENGASNSGGSGGIVLTGAGGNGGHAISFPATDSPTDAGAGGLVINTTSTSQGLSYTINVGSGGVGGVSGNAAGSNGANGYVIIEY